MVQFNVDSAQVAQGALAARRHGDAIRSEVQAMTVLLTQMEGSWRGGAAAAFQSTLAQWRATQQQVETALGSLANALDVAAQQYAEVESTNLQMFR